MAKVYAFLADGMEEVECLGVCDVLARAGVEVKLVSVMGRCQVTGSHGFTVTADALFEEITDDATCCSCPADFRGQTICGTMRPGGHAEGPRGSRETSGSHLRGSRRPGRPGTFRRAQGHLLSRL